MTRVLRRGAPAPCDDAAAPREHRPPIGRHNPRADLRNQLLGGGEQQEAPRAAHADALARSAAGLRRLAVLHFESLFARLHPKRTPLNWMQWKRVVILLYYTMIM